MQNEPDGRTTIIGRIALGFLALAVLAVLALVLLGPPDDGPLPEIGEEPPAGPNDDRRRSPEDLAADTHSRLQESFRGEPELRVPVETAPPFPRARLALPGDMILVPGGRFPLGVTEEELRSYSDHVLGEGRAPESLARRSLINPAQRWVDVPSFFMDRHEVTHAEYFRYILATGARPPSGWEHGKIPAGKENHPVTFVDLEEVKQYAKWAGKRVPSEIEWEKAARGSDPRWFPWGSEWSGDRCRWGDRPTRRSAPVGSFKEGASPYGILDLTGNVWEWTSSKIQPYPGNGHDREFHLARGFVLRGGSFKNGKGEMAVLLRQSAGATQSFGAVGFRCVRSPDPGRDLLLDAWDEIGSRRPIPAVAFEDRVSLVCRPGSPDPLERDRHLRVAGAPVEGLAFTGLSDLMRSVSRRSGMVIGVLATEVPVLKPFLSPGSYSVSLGYGSEVVYADAAGQVVATSTVFVRDPVGFAPLPHVPRMVWVREEDPSLARQTEGGAIRMLLPVGPPTEQGRLALSLYFRIDATVEEVAIDS